MFCCERAARIAVAAPARDDRTWFASESEGVMATREREQRFEHRMSDSEALMWNIEKDPWLNPSGAALTVLDGRVDTDHFKQTMRAAVAGMPRLFERVVPGIGRLATPVWAPDPEFDLDYHVRFLRLPKPGTERQLFDLAAQLYLEPFDRTRPLWRFVMIEGLRGGRSALWSILHHVVADGIGQMRMAEKYQQLVPDDPAPPVVDLDAVIAEAVAAHEPRQIGGDLAGNVWESSVGSMSYLTRRQLGTARRVADEMASWPTDPGRAVTTVGDLITAARSTVGAVVGTTDDGVVGGSPLWAKRSRHRHLEAVRTSLDDLKQGSKRIGVTINDVFLAGMVEGAVRYHADRGTEVEAFNTSFVLSTRTDKAIGGNSFTPVPVQVPGAPMDLRERVLDVSERRGGQAGGHVPRRWPRRAVGCREPAADVGGHPRRPLASRTHGLRHVESARRVRPALHLRRTCPRTDLDGPGGGYRLQRDRDLVRRWFQHRALHRPGRDRRPGRFPRRRRRGHERHRPALTSRRMRTRAGHAWRLVRP